MEPVIGKLLQTISGGFDFKDGANPLKLRPVKIIELLFADRSIPEQGDVLPCPGIEGNDARYDRGGFSIEKIR